MPRAFVIPPEGHPHIMDVKAYHKYIKSLGAPDNFFFYELEEKQVGMGMMLEKGDNLIKKGRVVMGPRVALHRDECDLPSDKTVLQQVLSIFSKDKKV